MSLYRPQFAYETPDGCRDMDFVYHFDGSNTPLLNQDISGGLTIPYIPLVLEQDAPFYFRGYKLDAFRTLTSQGAPAAYVDSSDVLLRFEDWDYNKLVDDYVSCALWAQPTGWPVNSGIISQRPVPLTAEIYCPPGSVLWLFLQVPSTNTLPRDTRAQFSMHGVKRFKECQ